MKIHLFRTGHQINERVCAALHHGFMNDPICATYGILRGSGPWVQAERATGQRTLVADKGYWKPGHFDGYYRLAWQGTQDVYAPQMAQGARLEALGLTIEPWRSGNEGHVLVCPPTEAVCEFFKLGQTPEEWAMWRLEALAGTGRPVVVRTKDSVVPLQTHLDHAAAVVTFNSSVGWEALRQGIPVVSDPQHSTVGSFLGTTLADLGSDMARFDRRALFSFMANRQFTLQEIKTGIARSYML